MHSDTDADNVSMWGGTGTIRSGVMMCLTAIFVTLYASALLGWLKPLSDLTLITRLEPIIFVILGYYFGRQPAHRSEKSLKEEVARQWKRSEAAQHAREQAVAEREAMEEKIRNASVALGAGVYETGGTSASIGNVRNLHPVLEKGDPIHRSLEIARRILDS